MDLARNLGLSLETHLVYTEDVYVLQIYSAEAILRYCTAYSGMDLASNLGVSLESLLVHTEDE